MPGFKGCIQGNNHWGEVCFACLVWWGCWMNAKVPSNVCWRLQQILRPCQRKSAPSLKWVSWECNKKKWHLEGWKKKPFSGWWFQIFFIFNPTWGNDQIWLIFFGWVETTNEFWFLTCFLPSLEVVQDQWGFACGWFFLLGKKCWCIDDYYNLQLWTHLYTKSDFFSRWLITFYIFLPW